MTNNKIYFNIFINFLSTLETLNKTFPLIAFFIFITFSCNNKPAKRVSFPIDTIDINTSLSKFNEVKLSEIASKVEYIRLQSDSSCYFKPLLQPIDKYIKFFENELFISDRLNLLSFSTSGKFLKKYSKVGRGPGEYMEITDFTYLPDKEKLAILCSGCKKIYFYNLKGEFLKETSIDFRPNRIISFSDKLILVNNRQFRDLSDYFSVSIISENGDLQNRLIKHENEVAEKKRISVAGNNLYILDNSLNFYEPIYDTIWRITSDFKVSSKSIIFYSKDKLPFIDTSTPQSEFLSILTKYVTLNSYSESEKYIFFVVNNKETRNNILFDKTSGISTNLTFNKQLRDISINSFYNDLDGGPPFWPAGIISGDKAFSLIQISSLKRYYDSNKDQLELLEQFHNLKIQEILKNSTINDNPIIMIVTLKSSKLDK